MSVTAAPGFVAAGCHVAGTHEAEAGRHPAKHAGHAVGRGGRQADQMVPPVGQPPLFRQPLDQPSQLLLPIVGQAELPGDLPWFQRLVVGLLDQLQQGVFEIGRFAHGRARDGKRE